MKTLTVDEAVAGERILIRQGDALVELRPATVSRPSSVKEPLAPREALRRLQADARLTSADAANYLREVREERLAAGDRHRA